MPDRIPQSVTLRVPLQAYLSSDHVSAATGKTIAITISKNGAAYGNPSAGVTNATEIASGSYYVDLSTTDTGTVGPLFVLGTSSGVDAVIAIYDVAVFSVAQTGDSYARIGATGSGLTSLAPSSTALSAGTGSNQISLSSGAVLLQPTQTGVTIPTVTTVGTLTTYTGNTPQTGDSYARIGATGSGLTSLAPSSTALSTTQWTNGRAALLDNLDAAISTRSTYAGADTSGTTTLLSRLTSTRAGLLDNLDAAISTRSTYAGGDTSGTTTLLARLTNTRAGLLDNLDAAISTRSTFAGGAVASVTADVTIDMTQAVPTTNDPETVGDCLHAARVQGFGAWSLASTTLTLKDDDGGTAKTFTLDSATEPTSRT